MRVLVTGGREFAGSHLVDRLLADGHETRILDSLEHRSLTAAAAGWHDFQRGQFGKSLDFRMPGPR